MQKAIFIGLLFFQLLGSNPTVDNGQNYFIHGVASGDPSSTKISLWSRITGLPDADSVKWIISSDSLFSSINKSGFCQVEASNDWTINVTVSKLKPDTYYWYKFEYDLESSMIGRTKTLPAGDVDELNIVAISCNAYESGYFNAFRAIGKLPDHIDAVVHLGDFIYEDYKERFIRFEDRRPKPDHKLRTLQDYRIRYAQYRLDSNLQLAMSRHPFIHIWDDHEITNNAHATNDDKNQIKSYDSLKIAASKAFYEWVPINKESDDLYRQFKFGNLASLYMLDGRLEGRSPQKAPNDPNFNDSTRSILGLEQSTWLIKSLGESEARWNVIGNPVLFSSVDFSAVRDFDSTRTIDNWRGYPYEKQKLLSYFSKFKYKNIVLLSGDSHSSWAFSVLDSVGDQVAFEFGVPAVSSGNWGDFNSLDQIADWELKLMASENNDHLKYVSLGKNGFTVTRILENKVEQRWYFIDRDDASNEVSESYTYVIEKQ